MRLAYQFQGRRSGLEAGGAVPCRPNPAATLLVTKPWFSQWLRFTLELFTESTHHPDPHPSLPAQSLPIPTLSPHPVFLSPLHLCQPCTWTSFLACTNCSNPWAKVSHYRCLCPRVEWLRDWHRKASFLHVCHNVILVYNCICWSESFAVIVKFRLMWMEWMSVQS